MTRANGIQDEHPWAEPPARAVAIHIGADRLASPEHAHLRSLRSCADTVDRMTRMCAAAGIAEQRRLLGDLATRAGVCEALAAAAARVPEGLVVISYSGHSIRKDGQTRWCLYDGELAVGAVAAALSRAPATARILVVADTCYASAFRSVADMAATLVVLAACGEEQQSLMRPVSELIARTEELVFPGGIRNPACTSYRWLHERLQEESPDVELPEVWSNREAAWLDRPFTVDIDG